MKIFKELKEIIQGYKRATSFLHKRERVSLLVSVLIMLIAGFLVNLPAVILGRFVDDIIDLENPTFSMAVPYLGFIVVIVIVKESLTVIRKYLVENIATQTEKKLTISVVDHLLRTDITEFISKYQIGALHGRIFRSIQGLVRLIKLGFLEFFPTVFTGFMALAIAFYQKPALASFMILVIPTGLFIVVKQVASQKGIRISLLRGKERIDGKVVEMLGGLETIRVENTVDIEVQKVEEVAEDLRKIEIKHHIWMAFYDALKYFNEAFFYVLVTSIAIYFAVNGMITKGDILTYSILFMSIIAPLRTIHRILDESHESALKVRDLEELQSQPLDESFQSTKGVKKSNSKYAIEVKDLSFSYRGSSRKILKDLSLKIKKSEKIGIVGASGCGKSTLVKILLRLIHTYSGEIQLLAGDLKDYSREDIAESIAFVPQSTYVFSGTIVENATYGIKREVSENEIIEALKTVNIYDEVISSLGGLDGKVLENGSNLSGGQKQRLALSRLVLSSPEILILDEATSALDNINEKKFQKNVERIFSDKTIIIIAHRLTTLENVDRIIVLDKGEIVQEGKYSELSNTAGLFQNFIRKN